MVAPVPQDQVMRMRIAPRAAGNAVQAPNAVTLSGDYQVAPLAPPPPWRIVIPAADGTELLVMREEDGLLVVEGDESRWAESAKRFLHAMMQWAGQVGIPWKDEVRRFGESQR